MDLLRHQHRKLYPVHKPWDSAQFEDFRTFCAFPENPEVLPWAYGRDIEAIKAAILSLGQRDYWSRLWTTQEQVFARDMHLFCGHHAVNFLLFARDVSWALKHWNMPANIFSRRLKACTTLDLPFGDFTYWISELGHLKCKDPRDLIFGLLDIVAWRKDRPVPVADYNKSPTDLVSEVAIHLEHPTWDGFGQSGALGDFCRQYNELVACLVGTSVDPMPACLQRGCAKSWSR
jgi:hypothetical protein